MAGKLWLPSTIILGVALILSFLVSISLPWLAAMDISRIYTTGTVPAGFAKEYRFGVWTGCSWDSGDNKECVPRMVGYEFPIGAAVNGDTIDIVTLKASWTRGLAIHPVITGVIALALGASLTSRQSATNLVAPLICALAAAITLIGFIIDIALHLQVAALLRKVLDGERTVLKSSAGPGFWLTLVVLALNLAAGVVLFIARRRELAGDSAYPMLSTQNKGFLSRFKK